MLVLNHTYIVKGSLVGKLPIYERLVSLTGSSNRSSSGSSSRSTIVVLVVLEPHEAVAEVSKMENL